MTAQVGLLENVPHKVVLDADLQVVGERLAAVEELGEVARAGGLELVPRVSGRSELVLNERPATAIDPILWSRRRRASLHVANAHGSPRACQGTCPLCG